MYRQYTQCYNHVPGDKPFNKADLLTYVAGTSAPGLITAILAFLSGANIVGFIAIAVQYAATITAVANQWLYHRLVCVHPPTEPLCGMGTVHEKPQIGDLGQFDNDQFFDIRLMPHREKDSYKAADNVYPSGKPGPSQDGLTETQPANDIYLDAFQGSELLKPVIADLPYDTTVSHLHCEAEGNFWQAMKDFAPVLGASVGAGAAAGAAAGCAIGALFGGIGCIIGAILGALIGAAAAAAAGAIIAFNSDPGNVEDANVGDRALGPIGEGDRVVVMGHHVYDGFHEGWHEFHPLMAVMKINPNDSSQYLEWDPCFPNKGTLPADSEDMPPVITHLTENDMRQGLASDKFRRRAVWLRDRWCDLLRERYEQTTQDVQVQPETRWTIHPLVDGCQPQAPPPIR